MSFLLLPLGHDRHELLSLVPSLIQRLFVTPIVTTHVGRQKRCQALHDCAREEVEAFCKACDLPDVPDDVDEFDDEGFEDDEFYE